MPALQLHIDHFCHVCLHRWAAGSAIEAAAMNLGCLDRMILARARAPAPSDTEAARAVVDRFSPAAH